MPHACAITSLTLSAFRNYASLSLETGHGPVVLTGHNGAGKTNILEAISLLAPGRGIRGARSADMRRFDAAPEDDTPALYAGGWAVHACVDGPGGETRLGTGVTSPEGNERRVIKINGEIRKSQAALTECIDILWLTPQQDGLFLGALSERRKFLDRMVYGFDAEHARRVYRYEHYMRERLRLLTNGCRDATWIATLERPMAELGVAIAFARHDVLERLTRAMEDIHPAFPRAALHQEGPVEQGITQGETALSLETACMASLEATRDDDARTGKTGYGIHRSDMLVRHAERGVPAALCSTGEQKALLLALMMAHARAKHMWYGFAPVLLLDEVVAHLDVSRRESLFDALAALELQAWMTGTDMVLFNALAGRATFLQIEGGRVIQKPPLYIATS